MARITNPAVAFFPVELRGLMCEMPEERGGLRKVPDHRAVVDMETGTVFTVVTKNYRLVTNEEAFKAGRAAWASVFEHLGVDVERDLEVFNVVMPRSRSFCHIDLIHREYRSEVWEQEFWLPFVRVTNSYNKKYALHFDLGFVRKRNSSAPCREEPKDERHFERSRGSTWCLDSFRRRKGTADPTVATGG